MKLRTRGELDRVDLTPLIDLLAPLRNEWSDLGFDADGGLVDPLSGRREETLRLVEGEHRRPGAVYEVTIRTPRLELPEHLRPAFDQERIELTAREAHRTEWAAYLRRRADASVQVGVDVDVHRVELREDDERRLASTLGGPDGRWAVDVVVAHARLPRLELSARADLTALLTAEDVPRWAARVLGGTGTATATVDAAALEAGGRLVQAQGRSRRLRGGGRLDIAPSRSRWSVRGRAEVRGHGLGGALLLLARRPIRRAVATALAEAWASAPAAVAELERDLAALRRSIDAEGGPALFLHRTLWDPDFDPAVQLTGQRSPQT